MEGSAERKRSNEIGMAIPLLDSCDLVGRDITGDALLPQRALATYIVEQQAHYHFTVKGNQPALERDIALLFKTRGAPDFLAVTPADHGRIETRRIWCSTALNAYINFPHVGQVFLIERESIQKKPASKPVKLCWASRVAHREKLRRNGCWRSIVDTGVSKASITSSIGTTTMIAAESAPASARNTFPACAASRSEYSSHSKNPHNPSPR